MTPRQRIRVRRALRRADPDPSETESELNIVPFLDIVVNLMLFLLATSTATMALADIDTSLAGYCHGTQCHRAESVQVNVTITERGFVVASRDGRLCALEGHDAGPLGRCLDDVRARFPRSRAMVLGADPAIPYDTVVATMDVIRSRFDTLRLSAGAR